MARDWKVTSDGFEDGKIVINAGCHHRRARLGNKPSACGGCYARATTALQEIVDSGDPSIARAVLAAMRAEKKPAKKARAA